MSAPPQVADWPRDDPDRERLLVVDPDSGALRDALVADLPRFFRPGDVVIVNDAATLPASLHGTTARGEAVELRLLEPPCARDGTAFARAVLFGAGDWHTRTEDRPPPPRVEVGDALRLGAADARVEEVLDHPRLVRVSLRAARAGEEPLTAVYRSGRPVQYAYMRGALRLFQVQNAYASEPWSAEPPSAGHVLSFAALGALLARGVVLARVTHAAGLSSTGDAALDARLPLPERYRIPAVTVDAIEAARARGGRVVAVGTSVVRALEGRVASEGALVAGEGETGLRVTAAHALRVVDGMLTGVHEPTESHFELLGAFAPRWLLDAAAAHAREAGYLGHEFGDSCLILPEKSPSVRAPCNRSTTASWSQPRCKTSPGRP